MEVKTMRVKTFLMSILIIFLIGLTPVSCLIVGSQEYAQGYSNGNTDGYRGGYKIGYTNGYKQGNSDGYTQGHTDGYSQGYVNGVNYIECWVIQNHPFVYSWWFNDAFSGANCP